jgi:hypothetical protein
LRANWPHRETDSGRDAERRTRKTREEPTRPDRVIVVTKHSATNKHLREKWKKLGRRKGPSYYRAESTDPGVNEPGNTPRKAGTDKELGISGSKGLQSQQSKDSTWRRHDVYHHKKTWTCAGEEIN